MSLEKTVLTVALAAPLMLIGPWAWAEEKHDHDHDHDKEHRQHGSHVHGIAALNLVLEGQEVHVELNSPAANIVGFEHAPASDEDRAALDKAVAMLKEGDKLFKFNDDAGCRMEMAEVSSELLEEEHGEHADEKPDAHAHEEGHDHDEHKEEHGHKDEHEGEGETHSDMGATYHFECEAPGKLTQLRVELFEAFSGMEKINVQYVIESRQGAAELTAKDHVLNF